MQFSRHSRLPWLLCALFVLEPAAAQKHDHLPAHLTGSWGTAASLDEGTAAQNHLHLEADGVGLIVGSTEAPRRLDGIDDGKPMPRAILGFVVRARSMGNDLTFTPVEIWGVRLKHPGQPQWSCRYDSAGPRLTCSGPVGPTMVMTRLQDQLPPEVARTLAQARQQIAVPADSPPVTPDRRAN